MFVMRLRNLVNILKENNIYNINILGYLFISVNFRIVVGVVFIYIVNELDFF